MRTIILIAATIGFSFTASAQNGNIDTVHIKKQTPEGDKIFTSVEQMPAFVGGMQGLSLYLSTNIQYPAVARKQGVQGKVILKFVVSKSGKVGKVEVMRDIGAGCGNEALRVVKAMPDWKPGLQDGKPVNVYFTLPVSFRLSDPEPVITK